MNWDDLKYFLSVCQNGSIRSAAKALKVNHATVSRRINSFELALGERLFERTPKGYLLTAVAEELYQEASHLEERLSSIERLVAGKDETLQGEIRVTLPDLLAQELLMEDFAAFCLEYPQVQLEIIDSTRAFNLANREADVAFRLCDEPPDYLIGRKLANIHRSCYISKSLMAEIEAKEGDEKEVFLNAQNWIGWTDKQRRPIGKIAREYPRFQSKHKIISATLQTKACQHGMGISILPCFLGDTSPNLIRVPPAISEAKYDLWVLSHPDLRKNLKIQTFVRFMTKKVFAKKKLIEGEGYLFWEDMFYDFSYIAPSLHRSMLDVRGSDSHLASQVVILHNWYYWLT